jgi:hypothetical protein
LKCLEKVIYGVLDVENLPIDEYINVSIWATPVIAKIIIAEGLVVGPGCETTVCCCCTVWGAIHPVYRFAHGAIPCIRDRKKLMILFRVH